MKITITAATLLMMACPAFAANTDKTLVAWVTLADKNVRAGSILTIQDGSEFDGIVFAERDPGKWMAGSDHFHRTQKAHPGPDQAIPADPNCAIFYKGRYHLHYIYQSKGHSFAHLSSKDMVHWKWHPTVLTPPKTGHGMFSGTAFLTKEGKPAIIYHGQGSGRNQIAFALDDDLNEWSETIAVEPRTADAQPAKMRHWDPDCWLMDDSYYALGGGKNTTLAKSKDLKQWEFLGELLHPDFPDDLGVAKDEDISCANEFKIGDKWMLLCISHGLGARYYLGDFKGLMDQKKFPVGIQSLPRELSLPEDGVLRIRPLRELEQLRTAPKQERNITVKSISSWKMTSILNP